MTGDRPAWRTSSYSGGTACVQVAIEPPVVLVRQGRDPLGPRLSFTLDEWRTFVAGVRNDEFEVPS